MHAVSMDLEDEEDAEVVKDTEDENDIELSAVLETIEETIAPVAHKTPLLDLSAIRAENEEAFATGLLQQSISGALCA
jgi:hypothetical protein